MLTTIPGKAREEQGHVKGVLVSENKQPAAQKRAATKHRGSKPGDKAVNRTYAKKSTTQHLQPGTDLLSSTSRQRWIEEKKVSEGQRLLADAQLIVGKNTLHALANIATHAEPVWTEQQRKAATLVLRTLIYGKLSPSAQLELELLGEEVVSSITDIVVKRFAITCYMQRRVLSRVSLPGMSHETFPDHYDNAKQKNLRQKERFAASRRAAA